MEVKNEDKFLQLIPKATNYIEYMVDVIIKLPRTEKFNIGFNLQFIISALVASLTVGGKALREKYCTK